MKYIEPVNLLYLATYKFRYLSQFVEYKCNQCVPRKVTLSSNTFVLVSKAGLRQKGKDCNFI